MQATIYHNPNCSNSRGALKILQDAGADLTIVEYLKTPPSRDEIAALAARIGGALRDIMRLKEVDAAGLENASDVVLLDALAAHPILLNRPIVVTPKGAKLCRPPELVKELL